MTFDLKRLTFFVKICDRGSVTAAARQLNVTQPVLSYHIAELERSIGEPLLIRRPDGVEPTEAGQTLLAHARTILDAAAAAEAAMRDRIDQPSGAVSIGLLASIAPIVAPRLMRDCRARFPLISLRIFEGTSLQLRRGVEDRAFDLAINLREPGDDRSRSLLFEDLYFVARRGYIDIRKEALPLAEALQHRLILPPKGHVVRALIDDAAQKQGLGIRLEAEVEGLATLKTLVAASVGPAIVNYGAIKSEYESGVFVAGKLSRPSIQRELILDEAVERHPRAVEKVKALLVVATQDLVR